MRAIVTSEPLLSGLEATTVSRDDWTELAACPICRSADSVYDVGIVQARERGAVTAVCAECEHGFMRRRPRSSWFDAFYAERWDESGRSRIKGGRRRVAAKTRAADFCSAHLPTDSPVRVLDVGAGLGAELLGFRERGHEVHGLERSRHRATYVRETLGIPCVCGPFEETELQGRFGLIFSNHVLEHVDDPSVVVARAVELLEDGGLVHIAVPNLWTEHPPQTFHFVPDLSLFTLRSLTTLLERHGLRVVEGSEGRDLQVLAAATASPPSSARSPEHAREFLERVRLWVRAGFGAGSGRRHLAWSKSTRPDQCYRTDTVARGRLSARLIRAARDERTRSRALAGMVARVTPAIASEKSLRMLSVRVEGDDRLPLTIRHRGARAPVWVK